MLIAHRMACEEYSHINCEFIMECFKNVNWLLGLVQKLTNKSYF